MCLIEETGGCTNDGTPIIINPLKTHNIVKFLEIKSDKIHHSSKGYNLIY